MRWLQNCLQANEQEDMSHDEVDDVVPLAVRHISHDESDIGPCNEIILVASTSAGCVGGCWLLSEGCSTNRLLWQSRWRGPGGSRTVVDNHTRTLS